MLLSGAYRLGVQLFYFLARARSPYSAPCVIPLLVTPCLARETIMPNPDKFFDRQSHQAGFTLVELTVVLVIIGLILAAVLKGQQMIENGKIKSVANDLRGVASAYRAYQERYHATPGDDKLADIHFTGGTAGDGDGMIAGLYAATDPPGISAESNNFWQHLRLSGFLTGNGSHPGNNSLGGLLGVQGAVLTYGMSGDVVCTGSIPLKIAQAVDIMLDDGDSATGTLRAGAAGVANQATDPAPSSAYGAAAPADTDTLHTLCMKL